LQFEAGLAVGSLRFSRGIRTIDPLAAGGATGIPFEYAPAEGVTGRGRRELMHSLQVHYIPDI